MYAAYNVVYFMDCDMFIIIKCEIGHKELRLLCFVSIYYKYMLIGSMIFTVLYILECVKKHLTWLIKESRIWISNIFYKQDCGKRVELNQTINGLTLSVIS